MSKSLHDRLEFASFDDKASVVSDRAALRRGERVLVTGSHGRVGRAVVSDLEAAGFVVNRFDLAAGDDVLDADALGARTRGCAGIVHLAAVDEEPAEATALTPASTGDVARIMRTNVGGTAHVLAAATAADVRRVAFLSSVDVFGCFGGHDVPQYLPIDDDHPVSPVGAYAWSKAAAEELCETYTRSTGAPSVCLRSPGVYDADVTAFIRAERAQRPEFEWSPVWEYGAFIDVRDLAAAVRAVLTHEPLSGHHRVVVCADDVTSASLDTLSLARNLVPGVPIRDPDRYRRQPYAALIDSARARALLGWHPTHPWRSG